MLLDERAVGLEHGDTVRALQAPHAEALADAGDIAPDLFVHALVGGDGVQREHEGLRLVDAAYAGVGHRADDCRAAGGECVVRRVHGLPGDVGHATPHPERAAQAGGQLAPEVIDPVAIVDPAPAALDAAAHIEWIGETRLSEGHHRRGETGGGLAYALGRALRRERVHPRWLGVNEGCANTQNTGDRDTVQEHDGGNGSSRRRHYHGAR